LVFSPINVNKKQELKPNVFKPPAGSEDISVNRLDYTTPSFCKKHGKMNESPASNRNYFGIALLHAKEITECGCDIKHTPLKKNLSHADIKIGYKPMKGEQLPSEVQQKVKRLTKFARLFIDPDPKTPKWTGSLIE
jgi:hypothetical protein